jgi:SAM-dependent methyltransferase
MHTPGNLFLPPDYRTNRPASADSAGTPFWKDGLAQNDVRYQVPVYRLAAKLARRIDPHVIIDIGCGSGDKLAEFFGTSRARVVGVDQESAIYLARSRFPRVEWVSADLETDDVWQQLTALRPGLVICADVIEHLADPLNLLTRLRVLSAAGVVLISTPDRSRLDVPQSGPPGNPRHVREWSAPELAQLVTANGFEVMAHHHLLPRRYSPTVLELKRVVHRALHLRAIPDRRCNQALELRATESP